MEFKVHDEQLSKVCRTYRFLSAIEKLLSSLSSLNLSSQSLPELLCYLLVIDTFVANLVRKLGTWNRGWTNCLQFVVGRCSKPVRISAVDETKTWKEHNIYSVFDTRWQHWVHQGGHAQNVREDGVFGRIRYLLRDLVSWRCTQDEPPSTGRFKGSVHPRALSSVFSA